MAAGSERKALAEIADQLCAEFGYALVPELPDPTATDAGGKPFNSLGQEDEQLIAIARGSLGRLAGALESRRRDGVPAIAVPALLTGAELVMRSELATGNRLAAVMPDFVYLVALPLVDQDEALELSKRTASLLEDDAG